MERRKKGTGSARFRHRRERSELLVCTEEPEKLVLDEPSADASAELMPLVFWQERGRNAVHKVRLEGIDCSPIAVPVIPKRLAMNLVCATFGDCIHHSTCRTPVFRRVVRGIHLKFLDSGFAGGVA